MPRARTSREVSTTITFDRFGDPTSITDALGDVTTYAYNANGQVTGMTQPATGDGSVPTAYTYDNEGDLTGETLPDGSSETWTYETITNSGDTLNVVATYVDPLGRETIYGYDSSGNMTSTEQVVGWSPSSTNDVFTYYGYTDSTGHPAGLLATTTDPDGHVTSYTYDSRGDLLSMSDPDGNVTSYTYDAMGDLLTGTTAYGTATAATTTYTYDALGQVVEERDPEPGQRPDRLRQPDDPVQLRPAGQRAGRNQPAGRRNPILLR